MATFITRMETTGTGVRVAVKDIIDVEGVPTTAGSRAVEQHATPSERDAPCLAGFRAAGARLVGKANLHELAMLPIGTNPWFGTPTNPLDPALIPGGSSSGSAVAVASGEADIALGSDTGGSIRVPAACCGVAGLKTTYGRVPLDGVYPLAPSLDTVGPMATTIGGVTAGMQLLEPGFAPAGAPARTIGRLRTAGRPEIETAVDDALNAAGFEVVDLDWDGFQAGADLFATIFFNEVWDVDHELIEANPTTVGSDILHAFGMVDIFRPGLDQARAQVSTWRDSLFALFEQVELLALPTLPVFAPRVDDLSDIDTLLAACIEITSHVSLFNVAGVPGTAQPVPAPGSPLPASLQLVGPLRSDELLLATAQHVEEAIA
jgi:amidase